MEPRCRGGGVCVGGGGGALVGRGGVSVSRDTFELQ